MENQKRESFKKNTRTIKMKLKWVNFHSNFHFHGFVYIYPSVIIMINTNWYEWAIKMTSRINAYAYAPAFLLIQLHYFHRFFLSSLEPLHDLLKCYSMTDEHGHQSLDFCFRIDHMTIVKCKPMFSVLL